jgi:hypothetical protein
LLDDAHSLQLHISAEKSASTVVLPINTLKLVVNSFNFFKNGEFSPENTKVTKCSKYENSKYLVILP